MIRSFVANSFNLHDRRRFIRVLWLAGILHMLFLAISFHSNPVLPFSQAIKALYELSDLASSNTTTTVSISIASHNSETGETQIETREQEAVRVVPSMGPTTTLLPQPQLRKRTISSAAHLEQDADYLSRWQSYVEQFGNEHYPEEAMKNNICGNLRLLVAINKDGSIHEINLRQSSGSALLDQSAIEIVKKAGPFEPLPPEIANDVEVLEIIRTWQFRGNTLTSA
jgi:TonB family protein